MGKVSQITASSQDVEVGGESFEIHPLTNEELLSSMELAEQGEIKEFLLQIMADTLQKDDPENDLEAISDAPSTMFNPIMEAVEEVNDLDFLDEEAQEEAMKELGWNK